jgi:hypothetical protein
MYYLKTLGNNHTVILRHIPEAKASATPLCKPKNSHIYPLLLLSVTSINVELQLL